MKRFSKLLLALLILLPFSSNLSAAFSSSTKIILHAGEMENTMVPLNCRWDYFDSTFVDPNEFYKANRPVQYSVKENGGKTVALPYALENGTGYATYHCRVENLRPSETYGFIFYKSIYGSADLYVNAKPVLLCQTTVSDGNSSVKAVRHSRPITFTADENGIADIVFHVSNYELARGGILLVPKMAQAKYMNTFILKNVAIETLLAGVLIILAIYNFIIFFLNRSQKMYLYLALLSIDLVFVACTLDFSLFSYLFGDFTITAHYKSVLIYLTMIIPLYNLYAFHLYNIKYRWNKLVLIIDFAVPLFYLVCPLIFTSSVVIHTMTVLYGTSIYLCWQIIRNSHNPKPLYSFNIVIIILMLITAMYGLLIGQYQSEGNSGIFLFKVAIMIFAICQSSLAGIKRDILSSDNRNMLARYEELNDAYLRFIPQHTINYLQIENAGEVEPGDNSICDAMIMIINHSFVRDASISNVEEKYFSIAEKYFEIILRIASANGGFVSKPGSEHICIIFPECNDKVVRTAVEILRELNSIRLKAEHETRMYIDVSMGIHTAKVAIGLVGNDNHMNSTECSAGINETMQICDMTKMLGCKILISEQALDYCRTYMESLFEGVMVELNEAKALVYKVIPYDTAAMNIDYQAGEE